MTVFSSALSLAYHKGTLNIYGSTSSSLLAIANYEENLSRLKKLINGTSEIWVTQVEYAGEPILEAIR